MEEKVENKIDNVGAKDYSCPSCGAPIEFNPDKSSLTCKYCGFSHIITGEKSKDENDFIRDTNVNNNNWGNETKIIKCSNCGAENVIPVNAISKSCPFCASNQVVETSELVGLKPDRVIPFQISKENAMLIYTKWLKKRFYTPNPIKKGHVTTQVSGVYLPCWTFDTNTVSSYKGRLGEHYTVTVGSGKNRHTETRTRYFNISGIKAVNFDDLLVNAGNKITQNEITSISPFKTNDSFLYDQQYLAGFSAEHYSTNLEKGFDNAKELTKVYIKKEILKGYNYDVVDTLTFKTDYHNITYKYVLIPTWIGVYDYKEKKYRYLVNGESGKLRGSAPTSTAKVVWTVLGVLFIIGIIALLIFLFGPVNY